MKQELSIRLVYLNSHRSFSIDVFCESSSCRAGKHVLPPVRPPLIEQLLQTNGRRREIPHCCCHQWQRSRWLQVWRLLPLWKDQRSLACMSSPKISPWYSKCSFTPSYRDFTLVKFRMIFLCSNIEIISFAKFCWCLRVLSELIFTP